MADVFTNDLRIREQESGSNAGTWGGLLNTTIRNIASAFGQGSETIPNASTHTITLADGVADEARSMYLKCTGGGQACTVTLAPNDISKVWIIDNETAHTLTFKQGNNSSQLGTEVAIGAGAVKMIVTNGAGVNSVVTDALSGLEGSLSTLALTGALTGTSASFTVADNSDNLTLTSTDADDNSGPNLRMYRNSGSPGDNYVLGQIDFEGKNDAAQDVRYGFISAKISDASDGTEDGQLRFFTIAGGTETQTMTLESGNVGIGGVPNISSSSGTGILTVKNTGTNRAVREMQMATATSTGIYAQENFYNGSTLSTLIQHGGDGATDTGYIKFFTKETGADISEKFRITSAGSVGIATSSPTHTLHVAGNIKFGTDASNTNFIVSDTNCLKSETGENGFFLRTAVSTAGFPSYSNVDDTNTGMFLPGSDVIGLTTGGTERVRITSAGLVGIGTTPSHVLHVDASSTSTLVTIHNTAGSSGDCRGLDVETSTTATTVQRWLNAGSELARVTASGNLLVGGTSIGAENSTSIASTGDMQISRASGVGRNHILFKNGGSLVGVISTNTSATTYATSSDYRLKQNVVAMSGATDRLKRLKPSRFNFIADADTTVDGFLAHEVSDVVPEAITGTKDAVDADGNPDYQGIDQSKLVPLLVATIQELEARLTALEQN